MKSFYDKVSEILEEIIRDSFNTSLEHPLWELPQRQEFGDLSSMVALKLGSQVKQDPLEIAGQVKNALSSALKHQVERIEILKPGFINIFLSRDVLINSLNGILAGKERFFRHKFKKKILVEFLSANPTGPLSIAHGRQAVIGDAIANILEFCGNTVEREYYLNDAGRQIELFHESTGSAVDALRKNIEYVAPEGGYKGDYILNIAEYFLKTGGKGNIRSFDMQSMIDCIKKDLKDLGVKDFTRWFSQQHELIENGKVRAAIEFFRGKDLIYEKDGALWFTATRFGDDKDRVVKKADGELTYFASDIAYHRDKAERGYDELINLWGPDHHGYIRRVQTAMKAMGYKEEMLKVVIIQLVTLKTKQRMSKREGTFVPLSDLIADVGRDAARFYYLTRKNSSHLEFDIDLAKEASFDNPLYYIQYVCARIKSIFRKAGGVVPDASASQFLKAEEEIALLRLLLQFSYCLEKAYYSLEPVFLIEFMRNLASGFHKFYERVRVIEADERLTRARLNLLEGVLTVFHCGLELLGITPVEQM